MPPGQTTLNTCFWTAKCYVLAIIYIDIFKYNWWYFESAWECFCAACWTQYSNLTNLTWIIFLNGCVHRQLHGCIIVFILLSGVCLDDVSHICSTSVSTGTCILHIHTLQIESKGQHPCKKNKSSFVCCTKHQGKIIPALGSSVGRPLGQHSSASCSAYHRTFSVPLGNYASSSEVVAVAQEVQQVHSSESWYFNFTGEYSCVFKCPWASCWTGNCVWMAEHRNISQRVW